MNEISFTTLLFGRNSKRKDSRRWYYLILMFIYCVCYQVTSFLTMYTTSMIFQSLNEGNQLVFMQYLLLSFLGVTIQSLIYAGKLFSRDMCAVQWREAIVELLHQRMFSMARDRRHLFQTLFLATGSLSSFEVKGNSISSSRTNSSSPLTSIDQRITMDVDSLCTELVEILEKTLIAPFVIVFYIGWLAYYIGWYAPIACFLYFVVGAAVCHSLTRPIIPLGVLQSQFEGTFRYLHIYFLDSLECIIELCGGAYERRQMRKSFQHVIENKSQLIWKEFFLNIGMNWFEYGGTTVCYMIVGIGILARFDSSSTSSSSERIVMWSRGVYAALTLISSCSYIVDSAQKYALAVAARQRINEFMMKIPHDTPLNNDDDIVESSSRTSITREEEGLGMEKKSLLSEEIHSGGYIECQSLSPHTQQTRCHICSPPILPSSSLKEYILQLNSFDLYSKDAKKLLVKSLSLNITPSMRLLIKGPTGSGKSSLLKLLFQILKEENIPTLYCPQSPYLVHQGSLWDNLHYPYLFDQFHPPSSVSSVVHQRHFDRARNVLERCQLQQYTSLLSNEDTNSSNSSNTFDLHQLSQGEKQCLAVARILFHYSEGTVVLLDEVTSAVDEETEERLYETLTTSCQTIISIGHRSSIRRYHTHELHFLRDGSFRFNSMEEIQT